MYWPKVNESLSFGKITVKLVTETEEDDHNIAVRKLELEGPNVRNFDSSAGPILEHYC